MVGAWRVGNQLYLAARNAAGGLAVHRSDGTPTGTVLVKQITESGPAPEYAFLDGFAAVGDRVVFDQYNGFGDVLWSTDGAAAGTQSISDVGGVQLTTAGGFAVYRARGASSGVYLTDGTAAGTRAVPGLSLPDFAYSYFAAAGGAVYVPSGGTTTAGLYRVTPAETRRLFEGEVYSPYAVGDRVYFAGTYAGVSPLQHAVGVTDGTRDGTQLLEDRDFTVGGESPSMFRRVRDGVVYGLGGTLYKLAPDAPPLPGVSGRVFRDGNWNGAWDPGEGREPLIGLNLANVPVGDDGRYELRWVLPGSLTVATTRNDYEYVIPTTPTARTYALAEGQRVTGADFGFARVNIVRGSVRVDANVDDVAAATEPAAPGWTVFADLDRDGTVDAGEPSVVTGSDGSFELYDVPAAGPLLVRVAAKDGWYVSAPVAPGFEVATSADGGVFVPGNFGVTQTPPRNYLRATMFDDTDRDGVRDPGEPARAANLIWVDLDGDGVRDPGEPARAANLIWVDLDGDGVLDAGEPARGSTASALFLLPGPGSYRVRFRPPDGWTATAPDPVVTLGPGERAFDVPLGAAVPAPRGPSLAGVAFVDADGDGTRDPDEPARVDARVYLDADGDFAFDRAEPSVVTDSLGRFALVGLAPGTYAVRQQLPGYGSEQTAPLPPGDAITVNLAAGEQRLDLLLGAHEAPAVRLARVAGTFFHDANVNGRRDAGEGPPTFQAVFYVDLDNDALYDQNEPTTSGANGQFNLTGLAPGRYRLRVGSPQTLAAVRPSTFDPAAGLVLTLAAAESRAVDVGVYRPAARVVSDSFDGTRVPQAVRVVLADVSNPNAVVAGTRVTGPDGSAVKPSRLGFGNGTTTLSAEFDRVLPPGSYTLTIPGTALAGSPGIPVPPDYTFAFVVRPAVVARHVFYNDSYFDGNDAAAGAADDAAVATDKRALLPGQAASFANYTSYSRGLNGVVVDIAGLPVGGGLSAADFAFRAGNTADPGAWAAASAPTSLTVRRGAGAGGSDRLTLVWADGAIRGGWLQLTALPSSNTGLVATDVFHFGNAPGESGDSAANTYVDGTDFAGARDNSRNFLYRAPIDFRWDYNRDSFVDGTDLAIARDFNTNFLTALKQVIF